MACSMAANCRDKQKGVQPSTPCVMAPRCREKKSKGSREDQRLSLPPDPFIDSKNVSSLQSMNFMSFLKSKDIAMVMFYETTDPQSQWLKHHFKMAAESTKKPGHAYAAVDCGQDPDFCVDNDVPEIPHFQLFSKGEMLPYFSANPSQFSFEDMKMWMEGHPVPTTARE